MRKPKKRVKSKVKQIKEYRMSKEAKAYILNELSQQISKSIEQELCDILGGYEHAPGDWHRVLNQSELTLMKGNTKWF